MSYIDFRNDYLTEIEFRLADVNLLTATNNELLASGALYKMAASVAEAEQIGASTLRTIQGMNATQLQTWLGDVNNLAAFTLLLETSATLSAALSDSSIRTAIFGSALAMNVAVESKKVMALLSQRASLFALFKASTALTVDSIPDMTGATTPSGKAIASSENSSFRAYNAFNNGTWITATNQITNQWIQYDFAVPVFIHSGSLVTSTQTDQAKDIVLQCQTHEGVWETAKEMSFTNVAATETFSVFKSGRYKSWRWYCLNNNGSTSALRLGSLSLTGFN